MDNEQLAVVIFNTIKKLIVSINQSIKKGPITHYMVLPIPSIIRCVS
jgi:hypothetical protein